MTKTAIEHENTAIRHVSSDLCPRVFSFSNMGAIKAFKKGVLYHGEDCNRGPKNDPPILEPAFLLVNR